MTDIQQEVKKVEKELSDLILERLKEKRIAVDLAQKMAADFLAILPVRDQQDLLTKMKDLSNNYQEVREIYLKEITQMHELDREQALLQMRNALAQGDIESALTVAKIRKEQEVK
ncbi:MAG TPA: hypothetical protein VF820_02090 [Patescibacteria group bacterium]